MRKLFTLVLCLLALNSVFGQLTGTKTIPGDYASIALAVTDLNTQGVGVGGVTFDIAAAYTETAPTGGIVITATGTLADPIVFQKSGSGANPLITAPLLAAATTYDGVVKIAGGDYITFDAIDIIENAGNTTFLTDWGYALVKASNVAPFNGCQYVTIKNCNISLNKANTTAIGIYSGNHIATANTALTITATTDATNNCKFFNNAISNVYGGISIAGFAALTPFTLYDQNNEIGVGGANTITNLGGAATSVRAIYAIYQNGIKIANNVVNSSLNGLTTTGYGIFVSTGTSSNLDIYNNTITFTFTAGTYTSSMYGINNAMGSTAALNTVNIYNNTISNFNLSSITTGIFTAIYNNATPTTLNIYGNTVAGNTLAGTGTLTGIDGGSPVNINMYSNNVFNNSKTGAGTMYSMRAGTALVSFHDNNIYTNTITTSGVVTTAGTIYGYYNFGSPTLETIYNNNIYGLSVSGTTTSVASIVRGLYTNTTAAAVKNIYSNQVYNLSISSVGGGTVEGIYQALGAPANVYKNKIYNLSASAVGGVVNGMNINSGTTNNVYNNLISDLRAPAATGLIAVNGINIVGGTTANLYYNTIFMNATSSSITTFGTSGIYASTTPTVNLRNNIVVNNSTPVGATAFTVAYRRSSATLTSYAATSNNNDFYAGTPSVSNLIFFDGVTPYQTIAAYKTALAPRDAASISENPNWVSTTGTDLTFLHISTIIPTQLESGGAPIASFTDDYDGDIRNVSTPDIGADEFNGVTLDITPPVISYIALLNTAATSPRVLTATVTDASGVPQSGAGLPMLYWKINSGSYVGVQGVWVSGSTYTFTFGSGVVFGDVISYYVVAQDNVAAPNIAVYPATGASGFTVTPPAASTPPTTPSTYAIVGTICGTINVGAAEPAPYNTLTSAIADFNNKEMTCAVTFLLTDATYPTETFPIVINANGGSSAVNTLTIKPAVGVTTDLSGASTASMIKILNNYTSIDGSNTVGGTSRNLTITNTSVTTPAVIAINSTGIAPIVGGTIKNCILINGANTSTAVTVTDVAGTAGYFNNITIQNNSIQKAYIGIYALAAVATGNGSGMLITGNDMSTSGANAIRLMGIYTQGVDGVTITNNQIGNIANANAESPKGIWLATGTNSATVSGNTISNMSLTNTGAYALTGIYVNPGATATSINVSNNTISNLSNSGTTAAFAGILSFSPNTNVTNNTITGITQIGAAGFWGIVQSGAVNSNCSGNTVSGLLTATTGTASGINIQGLSTGVNLFNNKISNIKNTNTGGYGCNGFMLSSTSTSANIKVYNNFVYDVAAYGYTSSGAADNGYGIIVLSGAGYSFYFNSVLMNTNQTVNGYPAAFNVTSGVTLANAVDVKNNIFVNTQTVGTDRYAIYSGAASTVYSDIDYNDYYTVGPNLGYLGANILDLAAWKTATGKDVNSISGDPNFTSATNLHIQTTALTPVYNAGTQTLSVTNDIDGDIRNNPPDIGADEFNLITCNGAIGGSASGTTAICAGSTPTITASGYSSGLGSNYQWQYSNDNFFLDIHDFVGQTNPAVLTTGTVLTVTYYRLKVTCVSGLATDYSTVVTITIKPVPIASAFCDSPMCAATDLYLNGSTDIGTTFNWIGPNGFTSTSLNPTIIAATVAASGTYSFTASFNGCTSLIATTSVVVNALPSAVTASASSSEICNGATFSLFSSSTSNSFNTTTYITPTAEGGFESGLTFGDNGWTVVNSTLNYWVLGNLAPAFDGLKGAHISHKGIAYDYTSDTSATSHFYRDVVIPAGSQNISLSFDWKGNGESGWDRLLIYTAPTTVVPVANTPTSNSSTLTGATLVWTQSSFPQSNYTLATVALPNSLAGTTVRLIFTWQNDNSYGTNPPIAIDNISLTSSVMTNSFYSWASNPAGFNSADQNPIGVTQLVNTEYIVTAYNDYGCSASANTTVTNVSGAQITTQPIAETKCAGQTATFTVLAIGPSLTYQWKKNGIDIPIISNPSAGTATLLLPNVSSSDATNYRVVVTSICGTPVTSNAVLLTVNPVPTAVASSNSPVCTGNTLNLIGITDIGTIYAWTGPNGFASVSQNPSIPTVTNAAAGTYSYSTTLNGCTSLTSTTDVVINQTPAVVVVTPSNPVICAGMIQQLDASGGTPLPSILAETFNGSAPGWIITNAGSSPSTSNWYYQTTPLTGAIGGISFLNFSTTNGGKFAFTDSDLGGSGTTTDSKLASPVFSTMGYSTASLTFEHIYRSYSADVTVALEISTNGGTTWSTLKNYNGTSVGVTTDNAQVTANENIDLSAYLNQTNLKIRFNYVSSWGYYWLIDNVNITGTPIPIAITWAPATDLYTDAGASIPYISGTPAITVYAKPPVNATYTATATSGAGCSNSGSSVITVPTPAAPTTAVTQPTCASANGIITISAPIGIGMTYSVDGSTYTNTTGIFNLASSSYTVTAKNSDGCVSAGTDVTINAQPPTPTTPTAILVQTNCLTPTGTITVTSPTGLGITYSIDGSTYTNTTGIFTSVAPNTYTVTAKNSEGCISLGTVVTITAQPPTPTTPTVNLVQPSCFIAAGTITVTSPTGLGMTYSIDGSTYTNTTGIFASLAANTYTVTAQNTQGCISTGTTVTINVQPPTPTTPITTLVQPNCTVATGTITINSPIGLGMTYSIDGSTYTNTTGVFTLVAPNTYSVTAKNSSGCISTPTSVTINPQPSTPVAPTVSLIQPSCSVATGTITVTAPLGLGLSYSINGITYTNTTGIFTSVTSGSYTVTVMNASGCISLGTSATINAQPPTANITNQAVSILTGQVFTVTPSGVPIGTTYTWTAPTYSGFVSGGSAQPLPQTNISGTLTVLSGIGTATYVVTPTVGACVGSTFTVTVTVTSTCVPVSIGTQATDNSMCSTSGSVTFTVGALGTSPFVYQWQYNNGGTWANVINGTPAGAIYTNENTATVTVSGITTAINHQYRCYVTNCSSSTNATSNPVNLMVNAVQSAPTIGTITQPTCSLPTGSVILNGLPASGNWTLTRTPGGVVTNGTGTTYTVTGLTAGTYTYTISNALGCGSIASANIIINAQPVTPTAPLVGTITQPTCTVANGTVVINGLPTGNWTLNPGAIVGSTPTTSLTLASGSYNYTVTNAAGCTSPVSSSIVINAQPVTPTAPALGTLLQPTCALATGSIVLMGLPVGNWTINPGSIAGATASTTLNGLTTGTHNYTITNSAGCTSAPSANVVINAQPATPSTPIVGTITQPTCAVGTGSVILSGLPSGNWAINPGSLLGSTSSVTISNLSPGTHTFTVVNAAGCTSAATINIVINAQPATPTALTVSTITQPTCAVATGSVVLGSLPLGTWTINPGAIGGSTSTATINGLAAGTYTYTVTNSVGCTSIASANVVINPQPATPAAPTIGTITQPTCTVSTGSVILTGLPTGVWTLNPGIILGNTTSKTITGLNAGTYAYSVTNAAGCTSAVSSNIVINAQPVTPTVNLGINATLCLGQTILLNAGNAGATYFWNPGGQTTQTKLVDGSIGVGPHTISVLVTSPNTCSATGSIIITFDACTGVAPTANVVSFSVNPNPSNGVFYLNVSGVNESATMNIFNMSGQIIYTEKFDNADVVNKPIDLKSYPKGMYFIKLVTDNYSHIEKIIVE